MNKLVHENRGRDVGVARLKASLAALAAQIMRLAAGGGSVTRMGAALDALYEALDAERGGKRISLHQYEAHEALQFLRPQVPYRPVDAEIDLILVDSLRLVASRLEGNRLQEARSERALHGAMRLLEETGVRRRGRLLSANPRATRSIRGAAEGVTEPMLRVLARIANPVSPTMPTPHKATLGALKKRKLIAPASDSAIGYRLTSRGQRELEASSHVARAPLG